MGHVASRPANPPQEVGQKREEAAAQLAGTNAEEDREGHHRLRFLWWVCCCLPRCCLGDAGGRRSLGCNPGAASSPALPRAARPHQPAAHLNPTPACRSSCSCSRYRSEQYPLVQARLADVARKAEPTAEAAEALEALRDACDADEPPPLGEAQASRDAALRQLAAALGRHGVHVASSGAAVREGVHQLIKRARRMPPVPSLPPGEPRLGRDGGLAGFKGRSLPAAAGCCCAPRSGRMAARPVGP